MIETPADHRLFRIVVVLACCLVTVRAIATGLSPIDTLSVSDNDDIMRFLLVQDWLAGQSWYDTTQYRMLPPEGLDLHWSRYVDLGIAGVIWVASWVLPTPQAEAVALVVWPTGLFLVLIGVTAWAARRLFGPMAALISVMALVMWPPTGLTYFAPSRIDHHNVQILLTTVMVITVVWPRPTFWLGVAGGGAAAVSLAVGLETLVTIALAGMVLVIGTVWARPKVSAQLAGFSLTLAFGATLLFAGQTAPDQWALSRCDELSLPFLALAYVGAAICLIIVLLTPKVQSIAIRLVILVGISAAGLAMISPLIGPCLGGPYDSLPLEVQGLISGRILEARPVLPWLLAGNDLAFRFVVPAAVAVALGTAIWLARLAHRPSDDNTTRTFGLLLLFGWLGLVGSYFQIRLVLMGAAAIPMIMGVTLALLVNVARSRRGSPVAAIPIVFGLAATLLAPTLFDLSRMAKSTVGALAGDAFVDADACRDPDLLRSLNTVSPGVVLSSSSYGPPILLLTHHYALAGPYHRSAAAIANGVVPFEGDEATLRSSLEESGAQYLLLCRDARYGTGASFATRLAAGQAVDWAKPVSGPAPALLLLEVAPDA